METPVTIYVRNVLGRYVDLSIIIVNYNVKEFLENLLVSLTPALSEISAEIIVVDNASTDGSSEMLQKKFPSVIPITNKQNVGFAKANNLALRVARGKYILLLNPDTIVNENTLREMLSFMESHEEVGLAGCKILNSDGTLQLACRRGFPGPWTSFCKVSGLSSMFPKSKLFARYNLTYLDENKSYEVDAVSGAYMMIRKTVYDKIGGLDEQFFMYGEDLDLCYRVQKSGAKVYYVHSAQIIHFKGESTKRSNINEPRIFYDAMRIFVRKHFASYLLIEIILTVGITVRQALAFLGRKWLVFFSALLDILILEFAIYFSEHLLIQHKNWSGFPEFAIPVMYFLPVLIHLLGAGILKVYKHGEISISRAILSLLLSFFVLTSLSYFFKEFGFSRAVVLITYLLTATFFIGWRILAKFWFHLGNPYRAGRKNALIIGASESAQTIAMKLLAKKTEYYQLAGFISSDMKLVGKKIAGVPIVGAFTNIDKVIQEYKVTEIIFSTGDIPYTKIMELVSGLQNQGIEFKVAGNDMQFIVGKTEITMLDDIPLVEITYNIVQPLHRGIKRLFDFVGVFLLPLLMLVFLPYAFSKIHRSIVKTWVSSLPSVLLGKMSFVGPKDSSASELYIGKKGITGLWFIEQGNEKNSNKLDIFYAKNQNIWLDLEILSKSFIKIFSGD